MARPLQLIIVVSSLIAASLCDVCVEAVLGRQFTFPENCSNDGGKLFRCEPHGEVEVAVHQQVNEGEKATFPCFYQPTCSKSETAQCVKNGQNFTRDKGNKCADGRLSLSPKRDCCPNVTRAEKQDGGDYFCYIQCGGKRFAAVVRLKVNGASTSPPASKPQQA
ncbi:uncharacterized protein LOC102076921 [Oreochromis niloticus]|uniref:uncharacterized protein LOC102076921 n=1 Tax=Oreochromis niloticus TaxID=8128 RepID=UPI0006742D1B|nr:uncharacterized protein LOC102076921 [Oreochromis niloticus]CAI5671574.1 unnamed protein product [Mustela putorius furo]